MSDERRRARLQADREHIEDCDGTCGGKHLAQGLTLLAEVDRLAGMVRDLTAERDEGECNCVGRSVAAPRDDRSRDLASERDDAPQSLAHVQAELRDHDQAGGRLMKALSDVEFERDTARADLAALWERVERLTAHLAGGQWPGDEHDVFAECMCPDANQQNGVPVDYCVRCVLLPRLAKHLRAAVAGPSDDPPESGGRCPDREDCRNDCGPGGLCAREVTAVQEVAARMHSGCACPADVLHYAEAAAEVHARRPVAPTPSPVGSNLGVTHECPPDGSGVMPRCDRTPFEVPGTDRLTADVDAVTCRPATPDAATTEGATEDG